MPVNTRVRKEENGTIPSPKGRQLGNGQGRQPCEHVGCFQFTKVEDGRCLVNEIQDEIQNWSLSNDPSEAELGTWAAHLASYIGMVELGQTKTLRRFRDFLRQQK